MTPLRRLSKPTVIVLCVGLLLFGGGEKAKAQGADAPAPPAEATSFDEVAARLDRGGSFYLYLSAAQWLGELSRHITEWRDLLVASTAGEMKEADRKNLTQGSDLLIDFVKKSGLEQVTSFGASSLTVEPGIYRNTFFVHHYRGKETGFLGMAFGSAPHPLTALDLLPADTAIASYGDFDLAPLVGELRATLEKSDIPEVKQAVAKSLAQFSAMTGMSLDAFLQSLGGSGGIILTLDPAKQIEIPMAAQKQTVPLPRLALLFQVRDDRIFQRIDQMLPTGPNLIKVDEPGLRMRTLPIPALPQLTVRATVARWEDFLLLSTDDQLVRDIIAARKTGHGLKASPMFAKLAAGLPTEGNGFSLITPGFVDAWRRLQLGIIQRQPHSTPGQTALMEKLMAVQGFGAAYTVTAHVDNGWLTVSKSAQNMNQILAPLVIMPVAIAAGVALPAFTAAQQRSKAAKSLAQTKQLDAARKLDADDRVEIIPPLDAAAQQKVKATRSMEQIKHLGLACRLYADDHNGAFPPSLDVLVPDYVPSDSKTLFISPFAPNEPMGYTYTPGLSDSSPADVVVLEDKFSSKEGQRIIVRVDGSAEVIRLPKK